MTQLTNIRGVVHGRTIELEQELSVPDGETVTMTISLETPLPLTGPSRSSLEAAAGSWADDADEIDEFLEWNRQQRKQSRPEIEEP